MFSELLTLRSEAPSESYPGSFTEHCDWEKKLGYDIPSATLEECEFYFLVKFISKSW